MEKNRLPRKKKKLVPEGVYCYNFTGESSEMFLSDIGTTVTVFKTKICPFYRRLGDNTIFGHCSYLNTEIMDQCKECNIKIGKKYD